MLILSRRPEENLILHTDDGVVITVKVVGFQRGHVRLGIQAPQHVHVDREEIYLRKLAEKTAV